MDEKRSGPDVEVLGHPDDHAEIWVKIVGFLQHNWAIVVADEAGWWIVFFGDTSGVFDEMPVDSPVAAESALLRNNFERYREGTGAAVFVPLPRRSFWEAKHPNGPIYSSGRYWVWDDPWTG